MVLNHDARHIALPSARAANENCSTMIKRLFTLLLMGLCLFSACKNPQVAQKSGSEIETDKDGNFSMPTYVSPEEYERMTPQERERLNAQQGVEARVQLGGETRSSPRDVPTSELDEAMSNARNDSGK